MPNWPVGLMEIGGILAVLKPCLRSGKPAGWINPSPTGIALKGRFLRSDE
jgi:hypothetical protein